MQPFPVVRMAGTETCSRVKLQAAHGAANAGRGTDHCEVQGSRLSDQSCQTSRGVEQAGGCDGRISGFERSLRFGVTLEVLVSKPGEIGSYTRFAIRRGRLPERVDVCLDLAGVKPMACPLSAA